MEIKTYLDILRRRGWIVILTVILAVAVTAAALSRIPPVYRSTAVLRILTPMQGGATYVEYQIYYANRLMNTYTQIASSNAVMEQLKQKLGITQIPNITVEPLADSEFILVTVEDEDPMLAMNAANTLAEIIVSTGIEPYQKTGDTAPEVLQERLVLLEEEIAQASAEYQAFIEPYAKLTAQISVLNRTISLKEQSYQETLQQYQDAQLNEAVEIYPLLRQQAVAKQQILGEKIKQVEAELAADKKQLETLSAQSTQDLERMNSARRSMETKESVYSGLVSQYDLARIAENIRTNSNASLVMDRAELPGGPVGPSKYTVIGLAFVLGLLVGLGLAFVIDSMDTRLHNTDKIEALTKLPSLGAVPSVSKALLNKKPVIEPYNNNAPLRESFRCIAANLLLYSYKEPPKSILISSADPREGKSTILANVAIALSQSRRRVIVIDGDMRLPRQHEIFELPNEVGLANVLAGRSKLEDAIQRTSVPGLDVLTSGPNQINPVELLVSPQFEVMMIDLSSRYDKILFDSPSLLAVADAIILAQAVDGVVMVVRRGHTRREMVQTAQKLLGEANAKMIGLVVNGVKLGRSYSYYRRSRTGAGMITKGKQAPPELEKAAH